MLGNNILTEFTRYREGNNQSTYKNLSNGPNVREEVRFAHTTAGKTPDGNPLARHLVGYEIEVQPTVANGLLKPERITVNLTVTNTPNVPVAVGTGDFAHLAVEHALLQICKATMIGSATAVNTGVITPTLLVNGEI